MAQYYDFTLKSISKLLKKFHISDLTIKAGKEKLGIFLQNNNKEVILYSLTCSIPKEYVRQIIRTKLERDDVKTRSLSFGQTSMKPMALPLPQLVPASTIKNYIVPATASFKSKSCPDESITDLDTAADSDRSSSKLNTSKIFAGRSGSFKSSSSNALSSLGRRSSV